MSLVERSSGLLNTSIRFLNQPIVKESLKNTASTVTFLFGVVQLGYFCKWASIEIYNRATQQKSLDDEDSVDIETKEEKPPLSWSESASKAMMVFTKTHILLSAAVSRPGVYIISSLVGRVFSANQLDRAFGPNTIFAINPRHPRHVVSIAAAAFALPSLAHSSYQGIHWAYRKIKERLNHDETSHKLGSKYVHKLGRKVKQNALRLPTDAEMTIWNFFTSRPFLHIANNFSLFLRTIRVIA